MIFRLKIAVYFDDIFFDQFGRNSKENVRAILDVAQQLLSEKETLGTQFQLDVMDIQHARGSDWMSSNWGTEMPSECMNRCDSKMNEIYICQEVKYCMNAMECKISFHAFEKASINNCNYNPQTDLSKPPYSTCMNVMDRNAKCEKAIQNCLKQCGKEEKCLKMKSER